MPVSTTCVLWCQRHNWLARDLRMTDWNNTMGHQSMWSKIFWWDGVPNRVRDDVIKWKHFPRLLAFCAGNHESQWRGALMFTLICARINGSVNNREAGDLRRYRCHYDVTVMTSDLGKYGMTKTLARTLFLNSKVVFRLVAITGAIIPGWNHVMQSSLSNSYDDGAPVNFIHGCPIFIWVAVPSPKDGYQDSNTRRGRQGHMHYDNGTLP